MTVSASEETESVEERQCGRLRSGEMSKHGCGEWVAQTEISRGLCKACLTAYRRTDHRRRAAKMRAAWLWKTYRLTAEDYDRMRAEQDYRCAVCNRHESEVGQPTHGRARLDGEPKFSGGIFVVDHCHESNVVRKLLCSSCNKGIGWLQDSPDVLAAAAEYLRDHLFLLDEEPRSRPMPYDHVEAAPVPPGRCRSGRHAKPQPGGCKECVRERQQRKREEAKATQAA